MTTTNALHEASRGLQFTQVGARVVAATKTLVIAA